MRYKIRRITTGSALRVGLMLGWLVALCPALCLAGVAIQVLGRVGQALRRVEPIDLSVFGQAIARIDFLEILRLSDTAETVARLTENQSLTFAALALLLTLLGAAIFIVVALLFSIGYNLLAALGGGLEVELTPRMEDRGWSVVGGRWSVVGGRWSRARFTHHTSACPLRLAVVG